MGWIQRFFAWLWSKLLRRTGYRALIDGEVITGCGQCKFNKHMRMAPLAPKAHYCIVSELDSYGVPRVIYDPCDIPEFCNNRVVEAV